MTESRPIQYNDLTKLQFELEEILADVMHRICLMKTEMDSKNANVCLHLGKSNKFNLIFVNRKSKSKLKVKVWKKDSNDSKNQQLQIFH